MRKLHFLFTLFAAMMIAACGNNSSSTESGVSHEHSEGDGHDHGSSGHAGHDHESFYTCEHHPEVHEHSPGKCSKCQMELVKKEGEAHKGNDSRDSHENEAYYTCPNHPGVHEHAQGICPTCGQNLVKK